MTTEEIEIAHWLVTKGGLTYRKGLQWYNGACSGRDVPDLHNPATAGCIEAQLVGQWPNHGYRAHYRREAGSFIWLVGMAWKPSPRTHSIMDEGDPHKGVALARLWRVLKESL